MGRKRTPGQLKYHREYMSQYRKTHPEYRDRVNRGRCERQKLNREATTLRWNDWRRKNADILNAKRREVHVSKRKEVIAALGGRCECCGEDSYEFMAIDHRYGDGHAHRREVTGKNSGASGVHFCNLIMKAIKSGKGDRFRILCHNCNSAFGWYGFCPHQKETLSIVEGLAC